MSWKYNAEYKLLHEQPRMEKPERMSFGASGHLFQCKCLSCYSFNEATKKYDQHITTLIHIAPAFPDQFTEGKVYEDGEIEIKVRVKDDPLYEVVWGEPFREKVAYLVADQQGEDEQDKAWQYFIGDFQAMVDRILRDKGAASKEAFDAINDVFSELSKGWILSKKL